MQQLPTLSTGRSTVVPSALPAGMPSARSNDMPLARLTTRPALGSARTCSFMVVMALMLGACGGGSGDGNGSSGGDGDDPANTSGDAGLVDAGARGDASVIETDVLLRTAARGAARGLGPDLDALPGILNDGQSAGGNMPDDGALGATQNAGEELVATLLGIDDPGAVVSREGNVITVDPDDAAICASGDEVVGATGLDEDAGDGNDDAFGDGEPTSGDADALDDDGTDACLQLVADLTVSLDAMSETTGVITYLFQNEAVVSIGYSPETGNTEVNLGGLKLVLERLASIAATDGTTNGDGGTLGAPDVMRGTVRLSSQVANEVAGSEAGEIVLNVMETVEIGDASGAGLTLEPSRVFQLGFDAATDEVALSIDWGALQVVTETGDSFGNTSRNTLSLGGLSLDVDVAADEQAPALSLSNVGIGGLDTPLTISIDGQNALSLALETFGVSVNAADGNLVFDTPASVSLALDNLTGVFEEYASEYTASFTAGIPGGTVLSPRDDGLTEVRAGGPVTASFVASDNSGSVQSEVSASVGSCFGSADADGSMSGPDDSDTDEFAGDTDEDPLDGLRLAGGPCP